MQHIFIMCLSTPSLLFCLSQMMTSMVSLFPGSTFPYPIGTIMIFSSILEVITFNTLTCAVVSHQLQLASTSIFLSIILCCRSIAWLACSSIMDIFWLQEIVSTLPMDNIDLTPEVMRIVAVVLACISLSRDIITLVMTIKLLKSIKQNGDVIHWSYRKQGLYW